MNKKTLGGMAAVLGVLALSSVGMGPAQADTNVGSDTTLVAVGSDTSQDIVEALSNVVLDAANQPIISNYKSIPVGRAITTRTANTACTFTAPAGSNAGRDALSAAMRGVNFTGQAAGAVMTNCVNVARSSSGGNPNVSPGVGTMTYIPFATDSESYATLASSSISHQLNISDLRAIYTANGTPGSAACLGLAPLVPALSSGTRSYFATTVIGVADVALGTAGGFGSCVRDTNAAGTLIQEHDGRFLTAGNQIVPFATAQFIAQQAGVITDIRGRASLGAIDWNASATGSTATVSLPVQLETNYGLGTRPLYNVVPTGAINAGFVNPAGATSQVIPFSQKAVDAFVGSTSKVCSQNALLKQFGLAPIATCGSVTKINTN